MQATSLTEHGESYSIRAETPSSATTMRCTKAGADTSTELPSAQPPSAQTPAPQEGSPALATESLRESGGMDREIVEREEAVEAAADAAAQ